MKNLFLKSQLCLVTSALTISPMIEQGKITKNQSSFNALMHIFRDFNNPGDYYGPADKKPNIRYQYSGTWATPTWAQVDYFFEGAYVYMFSLLYQQKAFGLLEKSLNQFLEQNGQIIAQEAMKQVNNLLFNYLHLPQIGGLQGLLLHAKNGSVSGYLKIFKTTFANEKIRQAILGGSVYSYLVKTSKDENAKWLKPEPSRDYNVAYDGGFNHFIQSFRFQSAKENLKKLYELFQISWDPHETEFVNQNQTFLRYYSARNFRSERRSGGSNYFKYWNRVKKTWQDFVLT